MCLSQLCIKREIHCFWNFALLYTGCVTSDDSSITTKAVLLKHFWLQVAYQTCFFLIKYPIFHHKSLKSGYLVFYLTCLYLPLTLTVLVLTFFFQNCFPFFAFFFTNEMKLVQKFWIDLMDRLNPLVPSHYYFFRETYEKETFFHYFFFQKFHTTPLKQNVAVQPAKTSNLPLVPKNCALLKNISEKTEQM